MNFIIDQLEANASVLEDVLKSMPLEATTWRQQPEKWCALEIVCHLYDEERDDFRFRTRWVLEHPGEFPPTFNPLDWIEGHQYMAQDYSTMINKLVEERANSIKWLRALQQPKWNNSYEHPKLGTVTARYFLTNWLAHDYLHLRQLIKLKFDYLNTLTQEPLEYAGNW